MPATKTSRKSIIQSSWQLFHRYGYRDTSLQLIADTAGLGKAGILHHFGSKAGVLEAVIDYAISWHNRYVLVLLLDQSVPFAERLRSVLAKQTEICQLNESGCFFGNIILETSADNLFPELLRRFYITWQDRVSEFFEERYSPGEARERAYRLFADYQGSVLAYKLYRDDTHLERFIDRALASLQHPIPGFA